MRAYQKYIHALEAHHGWLDVDLVHNCFLLGEEVGELFKAVRRYEKLYVQSDAPEDDLDARKAHVGEELVDVLNYLLAIANPPRHRRRGGVSREERSKPDALLGLTHSVGQIASQGDRSRSRRP